MAAMSSKILSNIHASGILTYDIEVRLEGRKMDTQRGGSHCNLMCTTPNQKVKICDECPLWNAHAAFQSVYGEQVVQAYNWWRDAWIRTGQIYAKDRMLDFVTAWIEVPPIITKPKRPITITGLSMSTALRTVEVIVLGLMLVQMLIYTWP